VSVTTVLVPVSTAEVDALERGDAVPALTERARLLRGRVAQVDAVREDLHSQLYDAWEQAQEAAAPRGGLLAAIGRKIKPPIVEHRLPVGYDPYVQLFGRSLPLADDSPVTIAERIPKVLALDGTAFTASMIEELGRLGATDVAIPAASAPADLEAAIEAQQRQLHAALAARALRSAWDALLRLCAWSQPIWRLDGELLMPLLIASAVATKPEPATALFPNLSAAQVSETLPGAIPSFSGGGGYFTPAAVKELAAALRFQSRIVQAARKAADDSDIALRNLRLLSEAAFYCEREGLGLAEAAGVEWHDRPGNHAAR
jgi:hypothetical protein